MKKVKKDPKNVLKYALNNFQGRDNVLFNKSSRRGSLFLGGKGFVAFGGNFESPPQTGVQRWYLAHKYGKLTNRVESHYVWWIKTSKTALGQFQTPQKSLTQSIFKTEKSLLLSNWSEFHQVSWVEGWDVMLSQNFESLASRGQIIEFWEKWFFRQYQQIIFYFQAKLVIMLECPFNLMSKPNNVR